MCCHRPTVDVAARVERRRRVDFDACYQNIYNDGMPETKQSVNPCGVAEAAMAACISVLFTS